MKNELTLLFTGGLDTTLTAVLCSKTYNKINLLTFDNGLMCGLDFARDRANEIQSIISTTRFNHKIISTKKIFKRLRNDIKKDFIKYKSPFVLDICDELAMHTTAVIFNKKKSINLVASGVNGEQSKWTKQNIKYIREINNFYNKYNQKLITPSYNFGSRKKRWKYLKKFGFALGPRVLCNWAFFLVSKQPFCFSELYGSPMGRLGFDLNIKDSVKYLKTKMDIAEQIISRFN